MRKTYCCLDDLKDRFGEEHLPLVPGAKVLDKKRIQQAIEDASALIESYLPFLASHKETPAFVKVLCLDIAAYRLGDLIFSQDDTLRRYEAALKRLAEFYDICRKPQERRRLFGNPDDPGAEDSSTAATSVFQKRRGGLL